MSSQSKAGRGARAAVTIAGLPIGETLLAFDPVPMARRSARGWTEARQQGFIAALAACGVVADAARAVGMSARSAYLLRQKPGAESFDAAWERAIEDAVLDRAGDVLDLALNGEPAAPGETRRRPLALGKQLRVFTALSREQAGRAGRVAAAADRQWHREAAATRAALDEADRVAAAEAEARRVADALWIAEGEARSRRSRGDRVRIRSL